MPTALWEPDGDRWVATELSRGPWDPRFCNGGPVAALLAQLVETVDAGMICARGRVLVFEHRVQEGG